MSTPAPVTRDELTVAKVLESIMIRGDLSCLTPTEKATYYKKVCESVGLNPLTRPFDYIKLQGKEVLYAKKEATEQLRSLYGVSVLRLDKQQMSDLFIVTAFGKNRHGREDSASGAVSIQGLRGEQLANAFMKAETKAKRRLTLSLCGLGLLDESEIDSVETEVTGVRPDAYGQPTDADGVVDGPYRIEFGKFAKRSIDQVCEEIGKEGLIAEIESREAQLAGTEKSSLDLTNVDTRMKVQRFIDEASAYIVKLERGEPVDVESETSEPQSEFDRAGNGPLVAAKARMTRDEMKKAFFGEMTRLNLGPVELSELTQKQFGKAPNVVSDEEMAQLLEELSRRSA